ncbi:MAG: aspartyl protease family protein [Chitinophagaceae bacterium]
MLACLRYGIKWLMIVLLLLTSVSLVAQEQFGQPKSVLLTQFSFTQLTGGIIILNALIDNKKDTLNFIFDTGSGGISFDSATVEKLAFKREKSNKTIRGIASMRKVDFTYNHTLHLPGLSVDSLDFHINDYDILTSVYGIKIDGIIGYSFLKRFIVRINYDIQKIEVYTPGNFKYSRGGYVMHPNFTPLPVEEAIIGDERNIFSRFILDTGAGLNLILSEDIVNDSLFIGKKRKRYVSQAEGLGGKKKMTVTVIKHFKLGPFKFRNIPISIFDDEYNLTSYPLLGGIIGNDLLRRFNVVINYPEKLIHLTPNSHYAEAFDYAYTGLGIYQIENEITVIDVIANSPAEKAGFLSGDIIIGVATNFSKNIQSFKNTLQSAGSTINVVVSRNGVLHLLKLNIVNILKGK